MHVFDKRDILLVERNPHLDPELGMIGPLLGLEVVAALVPPWLRELLIEQTNPVDLRHEQVGIHRWESCTVVGMRNVSPNVLIRRFAQKVSNCSSVRPFNIH